MRAKIKLSLYPSTAPGRHIGNVEVNLHTFTAADEGEYSASHSDPLTPIWVAGLAGPDTVWTGSEENHFCPCLQSYIGLKK
jgi:hypothetical protein